MLVVDVSQTWNLPGRRPITPQLISMNDVWNAVLTQKPDQERLRSPGIAVTLEKDVEYEPVLVHCTP